MHGISRLPFTVDLYIVNIAGKCICIKCTISSDPSDHFFGYICLHFNKKNRPKIAKSYFRVKEYKLGPLMDPLFLGDGFGSVTDPEG